MSDRPRALMQRLIKPTLDTPFRIDLDWWKREGQDFRAYLMSHLCPEHRDQFLANPEAAEIDWVDPETAEVRRVDGLWHILLQHCSRQPDFLTAQTPLTDAVFRLLLINGNQPMTPKQMSQALQARTGRWEDPRKILQTIGGRVVHRGIRPVLEG
ncbi:hypothetical protein [Thermoflexus sp.]|uniref:hypothetical protein n=1 Tax=Thermoflexus sp. TaxID=1969742 RepID=UPI0035E43E58